MQNIFANLRLPVIAAPMFLISGPRLVIEASKAGIVGTFPALNMRSSPTLDSTLAQISAELSPQNLPYGINLIVHHTNPRLEVDLALVVKHKVPLVITSLGAVSDLVKEVHSYGGLVFHDIINRRHAEKAAEAGVDGLICVSAGAGGHAGTLNPMPFIADVKSFFQGKVLLSGCISTGRNIASAMQMGADFAYMGTRFINTVESQADEAYKNMIIESGSSDIVYTAAVSGVPANFLRPSLEAMGITQELWEMKKAIDFGKELLGDGKKGDSEQEAKAWKTIWSAGQGVSEIRDVLSVKDLVDRLEFEFKIALQEQHERFKHYLTA
ncbi:MAG: nitronate monooxygenase family protein [Deinococcales bacterium]